MGFLNSPKSLEYLEEEDERKQVELSIEEKKALIAQAKQKYGKDWKFHFPEIKTGLDWNALKFKLQ